MGNSASSVNGEAESDDDRLLDIERVWVEHQPFLLSKGYQLRSRYHPDWIPSSTKAWFGSMRAAHGEFEDEIYNAKPRALDAIRTQDGKKVVIKRIETDGNEIRIIKYLDSMRSDRRNRTIPLLDVLTMPDSPWSFLVMPYCRRFTYPPFHCRSEFVEAMTQYIEGLVFMHEHGVSHIDIAPQNMVMDESRVVPKGSHFAEARTHTGVWGLFSWNDRCSVSPVEYYYIDFGLSLYYPDGKDTALVLGTLRTFPNIPELSSEVPYNPFQVDICQLGLAIHGIIDDYPDLEDFRPIASNMTVADPSARSTPTSSLEHLRNVAATITPAKFKEEIWEKHITPEQKKQRVSLGGIHKHYQLT